MTSREPSPGWFLRFLAGLAVAARALAVPVGACALVAVGVHAAADTVDDRILGLVDRCLGALDRAAGQFSLTTPLVDLVGLASRTRIARSATLVWELSVDAVLAMPALGSSPRPRGPGWFPRSSPLLYLRPVCTAAMVAAGACSVAALVQGAVYLDLIGARSSAAWATPASRLAAILCLGGTGAVMGWRPIWNSLLRAAAPVDPSSPAPRWSRGLWGTALALPLAIAAVSDACPVTSFFR